MKVRRIQIMRAGSDNEEGYQMANSIFENKMNEQLKNDAFAIFIEPMPSQGQWKRACES